MESQPSLRETLISYGLLIVTAACVVAMYTRWAQQAWYAIWEVEDSYYSHSLLIPFIAGYLLWRKRDELAQAPMRADWRGLLIAFIGLLLFIPGTFADMLTFSGLSLIAILVGAVWALYGPSVIRICAFPILYLLFMMPISTALLEPVAFSLRLLSTKMASGWLALFGQHGIAEGTSIIFSTMRVEVPNACSGMQSLMALVAALSAFVYIGRGSLWRRLLLLAVIPPVLVVSNGLRIALIAMIARLFGMDVAEGPLHGTSSALVFLLTFLAILGFAHMLAVEIDLGSEATRGSNPSRARPQSISRWLPRTSFPSLGLIAVLLMGNWAKLTLRPQEAGVEGLPLVDFSQVPLQVDGWTGRDVEVDPENRRKIFANSLLSRAYTSGNGQEVTLLVEYRSNASRKMFHTPDLCMPAAGWRMDVPERKLAAVGQMLVPVLVIPFEKDESNWIETYWYRYGGVYAAPGSSLATRMQLAGHLGRIIGRRQTQTLFRVGSLVVGSVQETYSAQLDLLDKLMPAIEKALADGDERGRRRSEQDVGWHHPGSENGAELTLEVVE